MKPCVEKIIQPIVLLHREQVSVKLTKFVSHASVSLAYSIDSPDSPVLDTGIYLDQRYFQVHPRPPTTTPRHFSYSYGFGGARNERLTRLHGTTRVILRENDYFHVREKLVPDEGGLRSRTREYKMADRAMLRCSSCK